MYFLKTNPPMLLLKDKERQKPHPYEMLSFGQWIGHRFKWSRDLRLEIFSVTPIPIYQYANDSMAKTYRILQEEADFQNTVEEDSVHFLIYKGKFIGYYKLEHNPVSKICSVSVECIAAKITRDIVLATLNEIQGLARMYGMQSITVEWDLLADALPLNIHGLAIYELGFFGNNLLYNIDTKITMGVPMDDFYKFDKVQQEDIYTEYVDLSTAIEGSLPVTFAIRDEKDKFMGLVVLKAAANSTNICEVKYLFVDPELRGQGIGDKLLKLVEKCLQKANINNIVLSTAEYMVPDFYRKRGYKIVASVPVKGNEHYVFHKTLPNADGTPGAAPRLANPLRLL